MRGDIPAYAPSVATEYNHCMTSSPARDRIILLASSLSYRADAFKDAACKLDLDVIQGLDMPPPLAGYWKPTLPVDFKSQQQAAQGIFDYAAQNPVQAIIPVDDGATVIAALASELLDLSSNSPEAAYAARNKRRMRELLDAAGVPSPRFQQFDVSEDPRAVAAQVSYPCVLKPLMLSGSQGVIRANNPDEFVRAFQRTSRIVRATGGESDETVDSRHILVEEFIPGFEVALEGILAHGQLQVLSLFDKPDPLDGPFFEETIYVTPSRLPAETQRAIADCTSRACRRWACAKGRFTLSYASTNRGRGWSRWLVARLAGCAPRRCASARKAPRLRS